MKKVIKVVLFIGLCCAIFFTVKIIYRQKFFGNWNLINLYKQPKNTIDVLIAGDSHALTTINPGILWEKEGISSYLVSTEGQDIWISYHGVVEALKTQNPEVIVYDIHNVNKLEEYSLEGTAIRGIPGMRISKNKWDLVKAAVPKEQRLSYFLEYPIYHSRYRDIGKSEFLPYSGDIYLKNSKGYSPLTIVSDVVEIEDVSQVTDTAELSEKVEEYLYKFIELSEETGIPVAFIAAPYYSLNAEEQRWHNRVKEIAEENGILYHDFNTEREEIGLDEEEDYADPHHLNYKGADKFSAYFSDFLTQNWELEDHRGEEEYISWDVNLQDYQIMRRDYALLEADTIEEYIPLLQNENYITIISARNTFQDEEISQLFGMIGINDAEYHRCGVWALQNQQILAGIPWGATDIWQTKLGREDLQISLGYGQDPFIMYAGDVYTKVNNGVNIMVYNTYRQCVVDSVGFDADNGYTIYR